MLCGMRAQGRYMGINLSLRGVIAPVPIVYPIPIQMEPAALLSSLCFLETCGLQISHLVTDRLLFNINEHEIESLALWEEADYFWSYLFMYRSTTVKTLMKTQFPHINHQADPWHFVKVSHEKQYLEISC